jgi:HIRAN domain
MPLFRKRRAVERTAVQKSRAEQTVEVALLRGSVPLEVVGESHRQDALWGIAGGRSTEHVRQRVMAVLIPETTNEYDPNAISVWVNGLQVGFLSRENAARYRPGLLALWQQHKKPIGLEGAIVGGGRRPDGEIGYLGVFLDHDPADFGLGQEPASQHQHAHVRTGLHEAGTSTSDLGSLPLDDVGAIKLLRRLLEQEKEALARHFAFADLEHRLYRCRDVFTSALDEFDIACELHHQEMGEIRPALLAEFNGIPLLETYKQACIRKQKAHDWSQVITWAERGIEQYADDALNPESMNDLKERLAHATQKLKSTSSPGSPARGSDSGQATTEELVCRRCTGSFTRVVTRGRKPTLCPDCHRLEHAGSE